MQIYALRLLILSLFSAFFFQRTPRPDKNTEDPVYSETFESPEHRTSSPRKEESLLSPNRSVESGTLSPTLSEGELSRTSEVTGRSPTFSSTRVRTKANDGSENLLCSVHVC